MQTPEEKALEQKYIDIDKEHRRLYPEQYKSASEFHESMYNQINSSGVKKQQSDIEASKGMRNISNYRSDKTKFTPEQKEAFKKKNADYLEEVVNGAAPKEVVKLKAIPAQEAKIKLWRIIKHKLGSDKFDTSAIAMINGGDRQLSYEHLFRNLLLYFIGNKESCFDLNKGICIFGNVGSGKSWIMEVFELFVNHADFEEGYEKLKPFTIAKMKNIAKKIRDEKDFNVLNQFIQGKFCYDDIGFESMETRVYGETDSVFASIASIQYDRFKSSGKITHGTTNLLPSGNNSIESKYGQRISDRCREMLNYVHLVGGSKRK